MKKFTFILLSCILTIVLQAQTGSGPRKLIVDFHPNIELLGLAYFIGFEGVDIENQVIEINGSTIPKKDWHQYGFSVYEQYKKYATSENLTRSFAVADHLWLDYIINLLIQVDDFPHAQLMPGIAEKYFLHFSQKKDTAEARKNVRVFLEGLNNFYKEINFKQYMDDARPLYASALSQVKANLPPTDFINALEAFYRKRFDSYILVPSLTLPKGMGFGLNYTKDGKTTVFNVFGAFDQQSFHGPDQPDLGFGNSQRLQEVSIHEFGHSFVNPMIDSIPHEKISDTERFFAPIKPAMEQQGYNTWKVCLYEHFVRAGEVMIAQSLGDSAGAQRLLTNYINERSFIYLPTIVGELENYKAEKISYFDAVSNVLDELKHK